MGKGPSWAEATRRPKEATVDYRYDSGERLDLVQITHVATNYTYDRYDHDAADEADVPFVVVATIPPEDSTARE